MAGTPQLCQRRLRRERGVGYSYAVRFLWQVDGAPWLNPLRAFHSTVWWFARMTRERGWQEGYRETMKEEAHIT